MGGVRPGPVSLKGSAAALGSRCLIRGKESPPEHKDKRLVLLVTESWVFCCTSRLGPLLALILLLIHESTHSSHLLHSFSHPLAHSLIHPVYVVLCRIRFVSKNIERQL